MAKVAERDWDFGDVDRYPVFPFSSVFQSVDVVMPDFTVDVSSDPTHSTRDQEGERRDSKSSRGSVNVERVDTVEADRKPNPQGGGGAELRIEVGDAYIRGSSGGE